MTPEQQLAVRPAFEQIMVKHGFTNLTLDKDGFQYFIHEVNMMWEGFLHGVGLMQSSYHLMAEYATAKKPSEHMEEVRQMRQYSKCFTGAYDNKEPVFVLRAQDATGHIPIAQWINTNTPHLGDTHPKIIAAKATLGAFMSWGHRKQPD